METAMENTVLYLLGLPGTGKYTIATEIAKRTRARLIDNHLINNPIFSVVRVDGKTSLPKETWDYTRKIGDIVREAVVKLATPEESFIFTNALNEGDPLDLKLYQKVIEVAQQRKSLFVPVRLLCDLPTLQSRIVNQDRHERMKMTDSEGIANLYNTRTILNPNHPHQFELDVTLLQPSEAANVILAHVASLNIAEHLSTLHKKA